MKSERHFWATLNYVLHNAVRHGYVGLARLAVLECRRIPGRGGACGSRTPVARIPDVGLRE